MKEKLTIRDLCTAKVLCKYELARLYENGTSGSEWAEQVQELSDVVGELLKETPKAPQEEVPDKPINADEEPMAMYKVATNYDLEEAVEECTQLLKKAKAGTEFVVVFDTVYYIWLRLLRHLVEIGYALSVNHDLNSTWYKVTFYKGGKVFK